MTSPFANLAALICFGPQAVNRLERGQCPSCGCAEAAATIRDQVSRNEFHQSGLCQNCQDLTFQSEQA